jgi:hypothetical protein
VITEMHGFVISSCSLLQRFLGLSAGIWACHDCQAQKQTTKSVGRAVVDVKKPTPSSRFGA